MKIESDRQIMFYEFICRECGTQFTAGNTPEDRDEYSFEEFFSANAGCFYATCNCPECGQSTFSVSHYHVAKENKNKWNPHIQQALARETAKIDASNPIVT